MDAKVTKIVFIDESGDPGLTEAGSRYFVMVGIVFSINEVEILDKKIDVLRDGLGRVGEFEFKFSKTKKAVLREIVEELKAVEMDIYCVVLDKTRGYNFGPRFSVYNQVLVLLFRLVSAEEMRVIIDGKKGKRARREAKSLFRDFGCKISSLKYENSASINGLQIADIIAGAINRKYAKGDDSFLPGLLVKKIRKILEI